MRSPQVHVVLSKILSAMSILQKVIFETLKKQDSTLSDKEGEGSFQSVLDKVGDFLYVEISSSHLSVLYTLNK